MADNHYEFGVNSPAHSINLTILVRQLKLAIDAMDDEFAVMSQMVDGAQSGANQFQKVVDLYGVVGVDAPTKLANAQAIFNEMNSAQGNSAALRQFIAKLG